MKNSPYFKYAELLLRVIPQVAGEECFALKGGTAINLFLRDMPRLSVDLDLTYLPIEPRDTTLKNIGEALERLVGTIKKSHPGVRIQKSFLEGSNLTTKLFVKKEIQIKIEVNHVIRGNLFPCKERGLTKKAEEIFELSCFIKTLSLPDLFGGKLCAALDRQHPRDIFDMKLLMENEGITDEIRKAFVIYLAGHDRPIHELIDPPRKDISRIYDREFVGMTQDPIDYEDLIQAREKYIAFIKKELSNKERQFLLSIKKGEPQWDLLNLPGIEKLPSIQWKLFNIQKMDKEKQKDFLEKLKAKLDL